MASFFSIMRQWWQTMHRENISFLAGGVAFYGLLAVFPMLTSLVSLYGLLASKKDVQAQMAFVAQIVPPSAFDIISGQLLMLVSQPNSQLGWAFVVSVAIALYAASRGTRAVVAALNMLRNTTTRRRWWRQQLVVYGFTLGALLLLICSILLVVALPVMCAFLPGGQFLLGQINVLRWLLLAGLLFAGMLVLFGMAPTQPVRHLGSAVWGAAIATILWVLAGVGLSLFIQFFPSFNKVYGSLGAVIILLLWFYYASAAILTGAALAVVLEERNHAAS
jgi:membrane protein